MAGDPGSPESGKPGPITERQSVRLGSAGRGLIAERAKAVDVTRPHDSLTSPEKKLQLAEGLRTGKNPETGDPLQNVNLLGGHLLTMPDGFTLPQADVTPGDKLCVAGIDSIQPDGSYKIYFAKIKPDGTAGDIVKGPKGEDVFGDMAKENVVDLQAAAEAKDLSELFAADPQAKKLFDAYTGSRQQGASYVGSDKLDDMISQIAADHGITIEEPTAAPTAQEAQQTEVKTLDAFISDQINTLKTELGKLPEGDPQRKQLIEVLLALQGSALADSDVGIFVKKAALEGLKRMRQPMGRNDDVLGIDQQLDVMKTDADGDGSPLDKAEDELVDFLGGVPKKKRALRKSKRAEGITDAQRTEWLAKIKNGDILSIINDKNFRSVNDANELVMGPVNKDLDKKAIDGILASSGLTEEEKKGFWKRVGGNTLKYGGLGIIAILLALPAGILMAGVASIGATMNK